MHRNVLFDFLIENVYTIAMACTNCTENIIFTGDTARVQATLRNHAPVAEEGDLVDTDDSECSWKVYDSDQNVVDSGVGQRESLGIYVCDWTAPNIEGNYSFEVSGMIGGNPQLSRIKITVRFRPGF